MSRLELDNSKIIMKAFKRPVVSKYVNSGRMDQVDESTEGACSVSEVISTNFLYNIL